MTDSKNCILGKLFLNAFTLIMLDPFDSKFKWAFSGAYAFKLNNKKEVISELHFSICSFLQPVVKKDQSIDKWIKQVG